jgi:WXG100 family type VII secretion target
MEQAQQISGNITKALDALESELTRTLSTWTGDAQAAYYPQQQAWHSAAQHMPAALTAASQTLGNIGDTYRNAELAASQTFGGH